MYRQLVIGLVLTLTVQGVSVRGQQPFAEKENREATNSESMEVVSLPPVDPAQDQAIPIMSPEHSPAPKPAGDSPDDSLAGAGQDKPDDAGQEKLDSTGIDELAEDILLESSPEKVGVFDSFLFPPGFWDPSLWSGSVELGTNGSDGNSQTFNFRTGLNLERKSDVSLFTLATNYNINTNRKIRTANRLFFDVRDEWMRDNNPWSMFIHGTTVFDEFRAFDVRVTGDTGVSWEFAKSDFYSLKGRFGAGFSREIGGPQDKVIPENSYGFNYEQQLTKRQKLNATVDYFPDMRNYGDFRLNSKANWSILLDEESNMSLKIGISDRYDSTPHNRDANDMDYSVLLLWSF